MNEAETQTIDLMGGPGIVGSNSWCVLANGKLAMRIWAPFWKIVLLPRGVRTGEGWFASGQDGPDGETLISIPGCREDFFTACEESPGWDIESL